MVDLALVRIELLACRLAHFVEQLGDLLLADALEPPLRLAPLAMSVLHETLVSLRIDQRLTSEKPHTEPTESQKKHGDRALPREQLDQCGRTDLREVGGRLDGERREHQHDPRRAREQYAAGR